MYAMTGKLTAQAGRREVLAEILVRASKTAGMLPGCRAYIVAEDVADELSIWVFEIWDGKEAHDESLKDERVLALIAEAMPLIGAAPSGVELRVVGGHGMN